ncbi:MAG: helix-turn-helix transcriptional regulator [Flavobacteriales bacterium]|nr:helix-turn-helix transcriptional regulator [Flavobacteriales bacterium]
MRIPKRTPKAPRPSRVLVITARELQVCRLLCGADEPALKALPDVLGLKEKTVQTHLYKLYRKLGVRTRSGLVLKAIAAGIIACPCHGKLGAHGAEGPQA